jgi:SAM-dependent methyltransferase
LTNKYDEFVQRAAMNLWEGEAAVWSLERKDPVVGWYNDHYNDPNEELHLFRNIPMRTGLVALEFGCGPGRNMIKFRDHFSVIDGVDISPTILEKLPINLKQGELEVPRLFLTNGHDLNGIENNHYDVVFSIICMQHISCRDWRLELYREFVRVLKPGGIFTFQMGYGPGHGISVDYFHNYDETDTGHRDVRVEDWNVLKNDLEEQGFQWLDHVLTPPCHDHHPEWIWVQCRKPL